MTVSMAWPASSMTRPAVSKMPSIRSESRITFGPRWASPTSPSTDAIQPLDSPAGLLVNDFWTTAYQAVCAGMDGLTRGS